MATYVKVAKAGELGENSVRLFEAEGKSIALVNAAGSYYALDNHCTHVGGPLCEGSVDAGAVIVCPWHGARFDVKTGQALSGPARGDIACYSVRMEGDDIEVEL